MTARREPLRGATTLSRVVYLAFAVVFGALALVVDGPGTSAPDGAIRAFVAATAVGTVLRAPFLGVWTTVDGELVVASWLRTYRFPLAGVRIGSAAPERVTPFQKGASSLGLSALSIHHPSADEPRVLKVTARRAVHVRRWVHELRSRQAALTGAAPPAPPGPPRHRHG